MKLPWFQFYPGDWLRNGGMSSPEVRGIFIDVLAHMSDAETRGELSGTESQFCRMLGCSPEELSEFLADAEKFGFCEVSRVTDPSRDVSRPCHAVITLTSRRMVREEKARETGRIRQQRHREQTASRDSHADVKLTVTPQSDDSHVTVTPQSQSQSQRSESKSESQSEEESPASRGSTEIEHWFLEVLQPAFPKHRRGNGQKTAIKCSKS